MKKDMKEIRKQELWYKISDVYLKHERDNSTVTNGKPLL